MFSYYPRSAYSDYDYFRSQRERAILARKQAERRLAEEQALERERQIKAIMEAQEEERNYREWQLRRRRQLEAHLAQQEEQRAEERAYRKALMAEQERVQRSRQRREQQQNPFFLFRQHPSSSFAPQPVVVAKSRGPTREQLEKAALKIQKSWREHHRAMEHISQLQTLANLLHTQMGSFALPSTPVFTPAGKLAYTSVNASVHAYEDQLVKMLTQLDAVTSDGSELVKQMRKRLVKEIEEQLNILDAWKAEQFASEKAKSISATPVEANASPVPAAETTPTEQAADVVMDSNNEVQEQKTQETVEGEAMETEEAEDDTLEHELTSTAPADSSEADPTAVEVVQGAEAAVTTEDTITPAAKDVAPVSSSKSSSNVHIIPIFDGPLPSSDNLPTPAPATTALKVHHPVEIEELPYEESDSGTEPLVDEESPEGYLVL